MIFVSKAIFAQETVLLNSQVLLKQVAGNAVLTKNPAYPVKTGNASAKAFLSPQYYSSQLGFFCKQEIKFDKITKIPFRLRLGSVAQCDLLEGKKKY